MFVGSLGYGNFLCMPRDSQYFRDMYEMPLEEALLHHLESARMTLCAGYMPLNSAYHPIRSLGRRTLSEREARRRHLPIYRYYPSQPGHGIRGCSLLT